MLHRNPNPDPFAGSCVHVDGTLPAIEAVAITAGQAGADNIAHSHYVVVVICGLNEEECVPVAMPISFN